MSGKYGVEWHYIAGLLIFIALFIIILTRTLRLGKPELKNFKTMIFESEDYDIE